MIGINLCKLFLCILLTGLNLKISNTQAQTDSGFAHGKKVGSVTSDTIKDNSKLQKEKISKVLTGLFAGYLQIKNSLSINDSLSAQMQALQLLEKIGNSSDKIDKSSIPREWELFVQYAPKAKSLISSSNSLAGQRYLFSMLSDYMVYFINSYGLKNKTVYILQCRNNTIQGSGKWLSDFNDGKNPYLGPGNESCIEVVEAKMF